MIVAYCGMGGFRWFERRVIVTCYIFLENLNIRQMYIVRCISSDVYPSDVDPNKLLTPLHPLRTPGQPVVSPFDTQDQRLASGASEELEERRSRLWKSHEPRVLFQTSFFG